MEFIGDRISIKRTPEEISIVILPFTKKSKTLLLVLWFALWTISGFVVLYFYNSIKEENTKAAVIVWFGFWAYFEYIAVKALLWRTKGVEKIKLKNNKLFYKRQFVKRNKIKIFEFDFIKNLKCLTEKENSFIENINASYWSVSGEKIAFDYYGKEIKFGIQLSMNDSQKLFQFIQKEIKRGL